MLRVSHPQPSRIQSRHGWTMLEYCIALMLVIGAILGLRGGYQDHMNTRRNQIMTIFNHDPGGQNVDYGTEVDAVLNF